MWSPYEFLQSCDNAKVRSFLFVVFGFLAPSNSKHKAKDLKQNEIYLDCLYSANIIT